MSFSSARRSLPVALGKRNADPADLESNKRFGVRNKIDWSSDLTAENTTDSQARLQSQVSSQQPSQSMLSLPNDMTLHLAAQDDLSLTLF